MRKQFPWLTLLWLRFSHAADLDAGAAITLTQANETAIKIAQDGTAGIDIDDRQVAQKILTTSTYTSYLITMETVTTPTTITSFYSGLGETGSPSTVRSTSTAASSMAPTGTCSMPPTVTAPCIISSNGECVKDYYNALQSCYKDGTFSTLKNIAQHVIECQNELGDNGSYNGFKDCSHNSLKTQLNITGTINRRSLTPDGSVMMMRDGVGQPLDSYGIL
ncbi:hypothetical protein TWF506_001085 [Arthrobotrys conoides]|uniref:Uncharacterized protein n=1 Tax=Arthrobotrys conoides TaxID=74498 RepID=A0AAN8PRL6_9PEZI